MLTEGGVSREWCPTGRYSPAAHTAPPSINCSLAAAARRSSILTKSIRTVISSPTPDGNAAGEGDRGYDSEPLRKLLRWLGIVPELAARNTDHGSGMGKTRWVVERTNAFLHNFGRLRRRLDRLPELQRAFLALACSLICMRFLEQ